MFFIFNIDLYIASMNRTICLSTKSTRPNLFCINIIAIAIFFLAFTAQNVTAQNYNWTRTNPGAGGAYNTVKVGPTGHVAACSDLGNVYFSTDQGNVWNVLGENVGIDQTHASSVGFHTTNATIFCIGTEDGIYTTQNEGASFTKTLGSGYIEDITFSSANANIAYASYHPQWNSPNGSVYKSTNAGSSWSQVSTNIPQGRRIIKLEVSPFDANLVYCLSGNADFACTPAELFRSTNGGVNWTKISGQNVVLDFEVSAVVQDEVYLTTMNANCSAQYYWTNLNGTLLKSVDQGSNWNNIANRTGVIWLEGNDLKLIDPREPYPWTQTAGTWLSNNDGASWTQTGTVSNLETAYINDHLWSYGTTEAGICKTLGESLTPGVRYWAHSRFVYGTYDGGASFENKFTDQVSPGFWYSRGVDNVVMHDLEVNDADPNIIYAGYWDIGFWRSLDKGLSWEASNDAQFTGNWQGYGGNAMTILSDPVRTNVVWTALKGDFYENGNLVKSTNTGSPNSWVLSNSGLGASNEIHGLALVHDSPQNNRTLFVTSDGEIYKSTNDGASWNQKPSNGGLRVIKVDVFDSNYIYAGGENGFWKSTDGGETWSSSGLSAFTGSVSGASFEYGWEGVTDISVDPFNQQTIYITVLGNNKGIYKSTDRGNNWTQIYNNKYMRTIEVSRAVPNKIFAGSSSAFSSGGYNSASKGILLSTDAGANWNNIDGNTPFPFALTIDLSNEANEVVYVGSPGSGFQYASDTPTAVDLEVDNNCIELFPNPVVDQFTIKGNLSLYTIEILDISGQVYSVINNAGNSHTIDISNLPAGLYLIRVTHLTNNQLVFQKIIKE